MWFFRLFTLLALIVVGKPTFAEAPIDHLTGLKGDYFRYESKQVGRPFHIYVRLPMDYAANPEKRYPVVYLLDGDTLFPILGANHLFLHFDENLPEAIVVGIAYGSFDPAAAGQTEAQRAELDRINTIASNARRVAMSRPR